MRVINAHPDRLLSGGGRSLAIYAVLWMVPIFIGTTASLMLKGPDATFNWFEYLALYFGYWSVWVLATPLIYRLLIVQPVDRQRRSVVLLVVANVLLLAVLLGIGHFYFLAVDHINAGAPLSLAQYENRVFSADSFWFNGSYLAKYAFVALACVLLRQYRLRLTEERIRAAADLRNRILESQLATARLALLQNQVQPHVFLNALNGVTALIDAGQLDIAKESIQDIAEFLRRTLAALERHQVPLVDDIELTRAYLRLLKLRFGDRIDEKVRLAKEAEKLHVPSLLTQPLVENIAKHVIERSSDAVSVRIDAAQSNGLLELSVADSGLPAHIQDVGVPNGGGIGLSNLRKRLEAMYGSDASMSISDSPMGGREVRLRLPVDIAQQNRDESAL